MPPTREVSPVDGRRCDWCGESLAGRRRQTITCSRKCRQARNSFRVGAAASTLRADPIRVAYADPPYPGCARRYYGREEVDHRKLVAELVADFPDGWALSTSAKATRAVWALCPEGTRLCPWVRVPRRTVAYRARYGYESLLVYGGRAQRLEAADDLTDVLVCSSRHRSHPSALVGMKPAAFAQWMFRLLGLGPQDELVDLFPGSGAIGRAWRLYTVGATRSTQDVASSSSTLSFPSDAAEVDSSVDARASTLSFASSEYSADGSGADGQA